MSAGAGADIGSQEIKPEDDYKVHGPYGLLRRGPAASDCLLSLVDVFEWMRQKGLPRKSVVDAVLAPLVQWDEADRDRRQELYVVNGNDYANPLSLGDRLNPKAIAVWEQLNFSSQDTYSMGTVREIADLWDSSWPGYVEQADQFYQDGWVQYCKQMKLLAQSNHGPKGWEEEYRSRYHLSLGEWKERCTSSVRLLSLLAVPLQVAHELWGWGRVATTEALLDAAASPSSAPAIEAQDVSDWPSLVQYRSQFINLPAQKRPEWPREHVALLAGQLNEERLAGRGRGALERLAKELGYSRGVRVSQLIEKAECGTSPSRSWAARLSGVSGNK